MSKQTRRDLLKGGAAALSASAAGAAQAAQANTTRFVRTGLPKLADVDVLVVGGGPAGFGAAIGAARAGAATMLVEAYGFFGGVASWSVGMPINQVRPEGKPRSKVHELLVERLLAYGDQAVNIGQHQLYCNVDYLKVAMLDVLDAAGCKYLVHLRAVDALAERGRVTGIVVATKNGLATVGARVVIDCTGDADVAYFSGAETMKETGSLSPSTLCFNMTNVSREQVRAVNFPELSKAASAKYPLIPPRWGPSHVAGGHFFWNNHSGTRYLGQFDTTDPFQLSEAECKSRRQVLQMVEAMREFGGENLAGVEMSGTGAQIAVRETRRVKGVYVLTEDDAQSGRKFGDTIAWRSGFLDIGYVRFEKMRIHDVPYRAILPVKMDGLLTAGRCISASHVAASAGKSMGNCIATGHAAGLAASISVKRRILPREVKVPELQDALRADGVDLTMGGKVQVNITGDRRA